MSRISICELAEWQAADRTFTFLDLRRNGVRLADGVEIPGAQWRDPEDVFTWKDQVLRDRPVILYCAKGHEISQGIAATLEAMGLDARYLIDGFAGWHGAGRPTRCLSR
ncbi:rhodanese-like domain-containing protein [Stutzerimonas stutzeri]|uniref:rhodanese-like domain-containing protein n=1 Tax=Stutzerimonas stutzeri TaxID=316 RepID=UPI00210D8881|nr:rhodanese-like domain-containing protein [Stutzerimonas stutzeri]MCQ4260877.1 rhodanese-like domain-containing protein [Stutzerimonas stutzeri]